MAVLPVAAPDSPARKPRLRCRLQMNLLQYCPNRRGFRLLNPRRSSHTARNFIHAWEGSLLCSG